MVTFHHADTGTPESTWREALESRGLGPAESTASTAVDLGDAVRLVVVAAHPDDETLGAGGLIALAGERGIPVTLVVATLGEASHPDSPTHPPHRLAELREKELRTAVALLHPHADVTLLGIPDGEVASHPVELGDALARLELSARDLVVAPWEGDAHPDHEAAGRVAREAADRAGARTLQYPIWLWHWGTPSDVDWERMRALPLTDSLRVRKRAALAQHRTQVEALSPAPGDEALLGEHMLAHFERPLELFVEPVRDGSFDAAYFDRMLDVETDPWGFETRWYERRKRAVTLASLPDARYGRVLELGCSTGVLSRELAGRADRLLAVDVSERMLAQARRRNGDLPHARFIRAAVPDEWPDGIWDLVVLSEIGYYLTDAQLTDVMNEIKGSLAPEGVVLACHWRHPAAGRLHPGDEVHAVLLSTPGFEIAVAHEETDFVLHVLTRPGRGSVAERDGVLG